MGVEPFLHWSGFGNSVILQRREKLSGGQKVVLIVVSSFLIVYEFENAKISGKYELGMNVLSLII
jgi:hypothetical protein